MVAVMLAVWKSVGVLYRMAIKKTASLSSFERQALYNTFRDFYFRDRVFGLFNT